MIPTSSLVMIVINLILGFAIPLCLAWWIVKKHNARLSTVLIGAAAFIVFALVLESIVHQIVLKGSHGAAIQNNTLYLAIYGGLMAGLFEETGRFLSMKYLLKKEPTTVKPALAYGIGHGGVNVQLAGMLVDREIEIWREAPKGAVADDEEDRRNPYYGVRRFFGH